MFLAIGARLFPTLTYGVLGVLILIYTLVGAALLYRSFVRHGSAPFLAALFTLGLGAITFLFFYFVTALFIRPA
jgi:hypothetical protein